MKMFNGFKYGFGLLLFVLIASCEKDKPVPPIIIDETPNHGTLKIEIIATMNGEPIASYTPFVNVNQQRATIEGLKFYLGEFALKNNSGNYFAIKDVAFFDLLENENLLYINMPPDQYSDLRFNVGVPDALNGTNNPGFSAADYGENHPLNIFKGMYWTWASGYIFLKLEGKIDTSVTQNQEFNWNYFYHIGLQNYYLPKEFPGSQVLISKGDTSTIVLKIEYNDIFKNDTETINMAVQAFTHTTDNAILAEKVITNFRDALRLE